MRESQPDWAALFDFSTPHIQKWEEEQIREAAKAGSLIIPGHVRERARERSISVRSIREAVRTGKAMEKDPPVHETRDPGIAFEKSIDAKRRIKVKVGYMGRRYSVLTAHDV